MKLNEFVKRCHETAKSKGWWEKPRPIDELYMLMVTEIAEASECARNDEPPVHFGVNTFSGAPKTPDLMVKRGEKFYFLRHEPSFNSGKPEGEAIELADLLIRLGDYIGNKGWDFEKIIYDMDSVFLKANSVGQLGQFALNHPRDATLSMIHDLEGCSKLGNHFGFVRLITHASHKAAGEMNEKECLAGLFLFVAAYFAYNAWDLEDILLCKMNYNDTRSYRHGGKLA